MTKATVYPPADIRSEWYAGTYPGSVLTGVDKILLHTTEGSDWPPYAGGSMAPNLTYHPARRRWRQHFPLNRSARALCDPATTAVRENRDNVVQVEIVAVCDPSVYRRSAALLPASGLTAEALGDLGDFLAFMHAEWGTRLVAAPRWLPYPASAGNSPVRMSGRAYSVFLGVLGHMHASGNVHGDPGDLDVPAILRRANRVALGAPAAAPPSGPTVPAAATPAPFVPVRSALGENVYRYLRTPDGRYWGVAGLQCTHLETPDLRAQWLKLAALNDQDVHDVSYDLLAQLQRVT